MSASGIVVVESLRFVWFLMQVRTHVPAFVGVSVNKQRSPVPSETSGQVNGGRRLPRSPLEIGDSKSHIRHL